MQLPRGYVRRSQSPKSSFGPEIVDPSEHRLKCNEAARSSRRRLALSNLRSRALPVIFSLHRTPGILHLCAMRAGPKLMQLDEIDGKQDNVKQQQRGDGPA